MVNTHPGSAGIDVRQKLNDLNHRLRFVLGEHDDPDATHPVFGSEGP